MWSADPSVSAVGQLRGELTAFALSRPKPACMTPAEPMHDAKRRRGVLITFVRECV